MDMLLKFSMSVSMSFRGGRDLNRARVMPGYAEASEMMAGLDADVGGTFGVMSRLAVDVRRRLGTLFRFYYALST